MNIQWIPLTLLDPHPKNPRLAPRQDVVDQLATQIQAAGKFEPMYALIVRPMDDRYQIVAGHHRTLAAHQAGLTEVPCWVKAMEADEAYMALVLTNIQGELHPLEEGRHALESGLEMKEYAQHTGKKYTTLMERVYAAAVVQNTHMRITDIESSWRCLSAIHPAPPWLWPALVTQLLAEHWTVDVTRREVKAVQHCEAPPAWADTEVIATALLGGALTPRDLPRFAQLAEEARQRLLAQHEDAERFCTLLDTTLAAHRPSKLSEVTAWCNGIEQEQASLIQQRQQEDLFRTKRAEEIAARTARLRRTVSLDEWHTLRPDEQDALLHLSEHDVNPGSFNAQQNTAIEWAQFSWNPVTGCLHNCPYCYARDIALSATMKKVYPVGFAPSFRPATVLAPRTMAVPTEAATDTRYRNVFTCSMADLFGRWVPAAWIETVFREMRQAPQWNFLCLTKFPKRLAEFEIPANAWMGTTVDLQARVAAAEEAFAQIPTGIRWLSIEPLLEPLTFRHLERFDWVVIGGASKSTQTPEWHPPFAWISDIVRQAMDAGCRVYFKTNLLKKRLLQLPFDAPLPDETTPAPAVFHYLKEASAMPLSR